MRELRSCAAQDGFTLIEVLISVLLVVLVILGAATAFTHFGVRTGDDLIATCLVQAASSGIEAKRANLNVSSMQIACGQHNVSVSVSGTVPASAPLAGSGQNACVEIVSSASIGSRSMVLRDFACRFPP